MAGWIKLYRELIDKPIWQCSSSEQKSILITLLCMANHEEKEWIWEGKKYKCLPGQFVTSLKSISEKSGTSIKNVRTALKNFEEIYEFLASKSTNKNRLVTIVNWELYQSRDNEVASKTASKRQAGGKQVATNKNDKNDKECKEDIYIGDKPQTTKFIPPVLDEVKAYCKERGNNIDPQKFIDHYTANGWVRGKTKIKDWKACIRTWEKNTQAKQNSDKSQRNNFIQREYDEGYFDSFFKNTGGAKSE